MATDVTTAKPIIHGSVASAPAENACTVTSTKMAKLDR